MSPVFKGDFIGQNVKVKEESLFEDAYPALVERYDGRGLFDETLVTPFDPYVLKEVGGARIAVIGQAFPRNRQMRTPQRVLSGLVFSGLREDEMVALAENDSIRAQPGRDGIAFTQRYGCRP